MKNEEIRSSCEGFTFELCATMRDKMREMEKFFFSLFVIREKFMILYKWGVSRALKFVTIINICGVSSLIYFPRIFRKGNDSTEHRNIHKNIPRQNTKNLYLSVVSASMILFPTL
jgi:hypothetical protein